MIELDEALVTNFFGLESLEPETPIAYFGIGEEQSALTLAQSDENHTYGTARFNLRDLQAMSGELASQAYVEVSLPRIQPANIPTEFIGGRLILERESKTFSLDGKELDLAHLEFRLLALLAINRLRVFSWDEIYGQVWGKKYDGKEAKATITEHARRVRKKIDDENRKILQTVIQIGFKFDDTPNTD